MHSLSIHYKVSIWLKFLWYTVPNRQCLLKANLLDPPLALVNEKLVKMSSNHPNNSIVYNRNHFVGRHAEDSDREIARTNTKSHSSAASLWFQMASN